MWITSQDFGQIAAIDVRTAQMALKRASEGLNWHGHVLEVRTDLGRGGNGGKRYEVKVSSLPVDLQDRLRDLQTDFEDPSKTRLGEGAQRKRTWIYDVIRPALAHPKNSRERGSEIAKLDGTKRLDWKGKYQRLSKTRIYEWIKTYEDGGIHALAGDVRSDAGKKKCWVSKVWHNAVPFDDQVKATIHEDLKRYVRGLIMGGSQHKQTRVLASHKLIQLTAAHGYRLNDPEREKAVFYIPHDFVRDERHYKAVYRRRSDRKAHDDDQPRIKRTIEGLMPMDVVVADIHHVNVRILRDDGTVATPKMIGFFDVATERFYYEMVLFEGRAGVRNMDVIRTFLNMCQDPAFGLPKKLYFDNGSEYRFADQLEDALSLGVKFGDLEDSKNVHRAKPYNAAAKRIEGGFRELNQQVFRHIQGWIDDDRMKPKGRELGKAHAPYRGGFEAFCEETRKFMLAYDNMPKSGALRGQSPNEAFSGFVHEGWRANLLDPEGLLTVFTKVETRVVRKHGIEADGRTWGCDGLAGYFGSKVKVHLPLYGFGFNMLKVCDLNGNEIGNAVPSEEYSYFDPRGAQESAKQNSIRNRALAELEKSAPKVDVKAELIAFGEAHIPVVPNEPDGLISVNRDAGNGSQVIMPTITKRKSRDQVEAEQRQQDEARTLFINMMRAGSRR